MPPTRRRAAMGAKAEQGPFAPVFGASDYVRDQLDPNMQAIRALGSQALDIRRKMAQEAHFRRALPKTESR